MTALILIGLVAMLFFDFSRPYAIAIIISVIAFQAYPVATVLIIAAIGGIYLFVNHNS